jgi:hypothetical protein
MDTCRIQVYSMSHVNPATTRIFKITRSDPPPSTAISITMTESPALRSRWEHLSDADIGKILALDKVSISQRKIASLLKCSRSGVQHVLATYLFETFQGRNPRPPTQRKTTECEDRYIERALKQNDSIPLRDITNIVRDHGIPISKATLSRRRSEVGLGSYVAAEKPGLRKENVIKRFEWAMKYKDWTVEDWKHIIWSDESSRLGRGKMGLGVKWHTWSSNLKFFSFHHQHATP